MGTTIISRRGRGSATIKIENYSNSPSKIASINLSEVKEDVVATATENYAFFAGGQTYSSGFIMKDSVDAYDKNLIKSTPSVLSVARHGATAAAIANYAIFAGGSASSYSSDTQAIVDAYDENLTRTTATELSHDRDQFPATTVENYALFGGGFWYAPNGSLRTADTTAVVDAYDQNLTRTSVSELSQARNRFAATTTGNYALLGGGSSEMSNNAYATVDVYTDELVKITVSELSQARNYLAATTVGNYALFGGGVCFDGEMSDISFDTVDVYDENLVRSTPTELSVERSQLTATKLGNYALFAGGQKRDESSYKDYFYDVVDLIDKNLVRSTLTALHTGNNLLSSASVGNYALFAGGDYRNSDVVDVYSIAEGSLALTLYSGSKYKFQNIGDELTVNSNIENISIPYPVTGYVKIKNTTILVVSSNL